MAAAGPPPPPPPPPKDPNADVVFLSDCQVIERLQSSRRTMETTSKNLPDKGDKLRASIEALTREFFLRGLEEPRRLQINNRTKYWELLTKYDLRLDVLGRDRIHEGLPDIGDTEWDLLQEEWFQIRRDEIGVGYTRNKLVGYTLDLFKKHAKAVRPYEFVLNGRIEYMKEVIGYDSRLDVLHDLPVIKGLPSIGDTEWDLLQDEWSRLRRCEIGVGYRRVKLVKYTIDLLEKYAKDE